MTRQFKTTTALVALALLAGACARQTPPPTLADFTALCQGYGFKPETTEMAQCIQSSVVAYDEQVAAYNSARIAAYSAVRSHTCVPMGGNVTCF